MPHELTKRREVVTRSPEWAYLPNWSVHLRFRVGTHEVHIGIHNSWRWESRSRDGSIHILMEGYASEEQALAASPCSKTPRLAYEELCRISFNPTYAWLIIDAVTGDTWGRIGFDLMTDADLNARAWLKAGHPEHKEDLE